MSEAELWLCLRKQKKALKSKSIKFQGITYWQLLGERLRIRWICVWKLFVVFPPKHLFFFLLLLIKSQLNVST